MSNNNIIKAFRYIRIALIQRRMAEEGRSKWQNLNSAQVYLLYDRAFKLTYLAESMSGLVFKSDALPHS